MATVEDVQRLANSLDRLRDRLGGDDEAIRIVQVEGGLVEVAWRDISRMDGTGRISCVCRSTAEAIDNVWEWLFDLLDVEAGDS